MKDFRLAESEFRFMKIVWENRPLASAQLVKLCADRLGWKKSTTYTTLRKLCEKGFLKNEDTLVSSLVPRDQVQRFESEHVIDRSFSGSLPQFVAAFTSSRNLSMEEIEEIYALIDKQRKENHERT